MLSRSDKNARFQIVLAEKIVSNDCLKPYLSKMKIHSAQPPSRGRPQGRYQSQTLSISRLKGELCSGLEWWWDNTATE